MRSNDRIRNGKIARRTRLAPFVALIVMPGLTPALVHNQDRDKNGTSGLQKK